MAVLDHTESAFERLICREMISAGWEGEDPDGGPPTEFKSYDGALGLYGDDAIAFVMETQPKAWQKLLDLHGTVHNARVGLLKRIAAQIDKHGTIEVLRKGLSEKGVPLRLAYFEPDLKVDETAQKLYEANRLRVVRQVRFDPAIGDSVDIVLFVNGIPTATAELKNRYTGQDVDDAIRQYREDRDPAERPARPPRVRPLRARRRPGLHDDTLAGKDTRFLPFNQGSGGAGQPGGRATRRPSTAAIRPPTCGGASGSATRGWS